MKVTLIRLGSIFLGVVSIAFCFASALYFGSQFMNHLGVPIFNIFAFSTSLYWVSKSFKFASLELDTWKIDRESV
jgi:hypothetical protein